MTEEKKTSTYAQPTLSNDKPPVVADPTQIAPFGNQKSKVEAFKRKTKSYTFARDEEKFVNDPDKQPWLLNDFEDGHSYTGHLQGSQDSTYCLFVFSEDGFKVVPVNKSYKFTPNLKRKGLDTEEAEDRIGKLSHNTSDRWMLRKGSVSSNEKEEGKKKEKGKVQGSEMKAWKKKLLEGDQE
jgi:transcription initiation factor TFIIF subunit alpha